MKVVCLGLETDPKIVINKKGCLQPLLFSLFLSYSLDSMEKQKEICIPVRTEEILSYWMEAVGNTYSKKWSFHVCQKVPYRWSWFINFPTPWIGNHGRLSPFTTKRLSPRAKRTQLLKIHTADELGKEGFRNSGNSNIASKAWNVGLTMKIIKWKALISPVLCL